MQSHSVRSQCPNKNLKNFSQRSPNNSSICLFRPLNRDGDCNTGSRLVQCGELEQKLGEARRDFIAAATKDFLQPLHTFLEGDMKTVQVRS